MWVDTVTPNSFTFLYARKATNLDQFALLQVLDTPMKFIHTHVGRTAAAIIDFTIDLERAVVVLP